MSGVTKNIYQDKVTAILKKFRDGHSEFIKKHKIVRIRVMDRTYIKIDLSDGESYMYNYIDDILEKDVVDVNIPLNEYEWRVKFSERLRNLMFERGKSINKMAEESSIAATCWGSYLKARQTPSAYKLAIIAKTFGVTTDSLIMFDD